MGINRDYLGRTFPVTEPYEVSRVKIAEFAAAIGDPNPFTGTGRSPGGRASDVIAPPTFPVVIAMAASGRAVADPGLGLNYAAVVHGGSGSYSRPLHAGDVVTAQSTISAIREVGSITMLTTETEIRTVDGEHVCTGFSTLVERGEA